MSEVHGDDDQSHGDAERDDFDRLAQGNHACRTDCAERDTDSHNALQHARLGKVEVECHFSPADDDELQGSSRTPEKCGDGQRYLPKPVAPKQRKTVAEFTNQVQGIHVQRSMIDARIRDVKVEYRSCDVKHGNKT